ncbi:alpha/beta fold hydrolase [Teredinibacter haidensis]|uniref:alpha/beta fold hydrolase n=1 Tax=Teredinibacter haidensis TaxID=2731755 RepID=UPI000948B55B|nr:alpha/beta fold hydrolase [Teredinibacter haidensis]
MNSTAVTWDVGGQTIAGLRWGTAGGQPVIALHGWLDNCASFQFLAPKLGNMDLLALDLPGHGQSYHRSHLGAYNIWQDIADILSVAEQMGWQKFSLLGHSRGAMIATLLAATFPEKIERVMLIEALVPEPLDAVSAPAQLASSIVNLMVVAKRDRRFYSSFEHAVESRMNGFVPLNYEDARALAERGVLKSEQGHYWANDYKVMAPSEVKFTSEQVAAFLNCLNAPVQLVIANSGLVKTFREYAFFLDLIKNLEIVELDGYHHLHMSTQANTIASHANAFFTVSGS